MNWKESNGKLVKNIKCEDFEEALALLNKIALVAEELNHHPDLKIYSYKFLSIEIYTHDTNSITPKDHKLVKEIDLILSKK